MGRKQVVPLLSGCLVLALLIFGVWFSLEQSESSEFRADVIDALSVDEDITGFQRALKVREFHFPADFGPHPGFQTEWWYYTGNLDDLQGRHFGFQLTFFRRALKSDIPFGESEWRTNQIYFAHFALTDVAQDKFFSFERFSRGALGLAGARPHPYGIWLENWSVRENGEGLLLSAESGAVFLQLLLKPVKPVVLQGDQGLSRKGSQPGNAPYYFSQTRLSASGTINIESDSFDVSGLAWLDREWSTSALEKSESGWDWFSIQLSDNREIMVF